MMLTDLADVLRAAGLEVIEEPGWKTRGHGQMIDVLGVTCHHTGGLKDLSTIVNGRDLGLPTELKGPLAHLFLARDGVYHVVAAGLCWHAGESRSATMTNSHRIGIEAEAKGVPGTIGDWPKVQMDAYARGCAALAKRYRFGVVQVLGHKETCAPLGRKTDPDFDMTAFRHAVAGVDLSPPPKEPDVALTDSDVAKVARAVWTDDPPLVAQQTGGALHELDLRSASTEKRLGPIEAQLASNGAQLSTLAGKVDQILALLAPPATP
jgi:hypothetical protein